MLRRVSVSPMTAPRKPLTLVQRLAAAALALLVVLTAIGILLRPGIILGPWTPARLVELAALTGVDIVFYVALWISWHSKT